MNSSTLFRNSRLPKSLRQNLIKFNRDSLRTGLTLQDASSIQHEAAWNAVIDAYASKNMSDLTQSYETLKIQISNLEHEQSKSFDLRLGEQAAVLIAERNRELEINEIELGVTAERKRFLHAAKNNACLNREDIISQMEGDIPAARVFFDRPSASIITITTFTLLEMPITYLSLEAALENLPSLLNLVVCTVFSLLIGITIHLAGEQLIRRK